MSPKQSGTVRDFSFVARIVEVKQPQAIMLKNVKSLTNKITARC